MTSTCFPTGGVAGPKYMNTSKTFETAKMPQEKTGQFTLPWLPHGGGLEPCFWALCVMAIIFNPLSLVHTPCLGKEVTQRGLHSFKTTYRISLVDLQMWVFDPQAVYLYSSNSMKMFKAILYHTIPSALQCFYFPSRITRAGMNGLAHSW